MKTKQVNKKFDLEKMEVVKLKTKNMMKIVGGQAGNPTITDDKTITDLITIVVTQ